MLQGQAGADVLSVSNWSNSDIVHFSCHGSAEPRFSPVSHLRIAGDVLMAHDVLYECGPMKDGAIVVLNGCQTYVKDRRSVDEGMGLATAFLARGAGMVLATLWNLNDYAGAAVVTDFLRRIIREKDEGGKPMAPAKALAAAVNALRATTWEQAVKAGRECLAMFPEGTPERAKAKLMCDHYENGQRASHDFRAPGNTRPPRVSTTGPEDASAWFEAAEPFEHPYYWAGFQLVGRFA
jgi:CHAT domain-containing protein